MRKVLHAEWTKLRTVAGTGWLLLASIALTVALSAGAAAAVKCPSAGCGQDPAKLSLTGIDLGQAVVAILVLMAISGEYQTGMIRITLVAMPRRSTVLAAKAAIVTGVVLAPGPSPCSDPCWLAGSSCPATASPRRTATRRCPWPTGRRCAPRAARCSTSP